MYICVCISIDLYTYKLEDFCLMVECKKLYYTIFSIQKSGKIDKREKSQLLKTHWKEADTKKTQCIELMNTQVPGSFFSLQDTVDQLCLWQFNATAV